MTTRVRRPRSYPGKWRRLLRVKYAAVLLAWLMAMAALVLSDAPSWLAPAPSCLAMVALTLMSRLDHTAGPVPQEAPPVPQADLGRALEEVPRPSRRAVRGTVVMAAVFLTLGLALGAAALWIAAAPPASVEDDTAMRVLAAVVATFVGAVSPAGMREARLLWQLRRSLATGSAPRHAGVVVGEVDGEPIVQRSDGVRIALRAGPGVVDRLAQDDVVVLDGLVTNRNVVVSAKARTGLTRFRVLLE
ncbi:MAG: hypothetical protein U0Q15_04130 [Kineosporiaceae bacterium]